MVYAYICINYQKLIWILVIVVIVDVFKTITFNLQLL